MKALNKSGQNAQQSAMVLFLSTVAVKIISACFKIPLSSNTFLGDLGFGYFSVAYDLFVPFYTLAISGLPSALSHIIAELIAENRYCDIKNTFSLTKRLFILFGFIFSIVISLLAIPFVKLTDNSGNTLYSIYAVIPSIFLCFIVSAYRGYYEGFRNMNPTAISKIIEAFCKLFLGLGFGFAANIITHNPAVSAGAAMLGITFGTLVSTLYLHYKYKTDGDLIKEEYIQSNQINNRKTIRTILSIALPMAFSSLIASAVSVIDALTVRSLLAGDTSALYEIYKPAIDSYNSYSTFALESGDLPTYLYGLRSKAFTMFNLVPTLTMSFGVGVLPSLTECWVKKDQEGVNKNFNTVIKLIALIAFPSGLAFIAVSKPIMSLLYSNYGAINVSGNLLTIFGFTAIFAGFAIPLTSILQSLGKQFSALINIIIGVGIKVVLNCVLIGNTKINIYGSAISTTVCYLFIIVLHIVVLNKTKVKFHDIKNTILKPAAASLFSVLSAFLICMISQKEIVVCVAILVAIIIYIVVVLLLNTLTKDEVLNLPMGKKLYFLANKLKLLK